MTNSLSRLLDQIRFDLRVSFRALRREIAFSTFVCLIIGLGIGASATVFSVMEAVLIRPLPFKDPSRLVWIENRIAEEGDLSGKTVQVGRLLDLRARNKSFSDIAGYFAFYGVGDAKLTSNGEPERLSAVPVSQNFFPLLGIQPQLGRLFSAEECKWNGPHVVLLSYGLWQRRFAGDPGIVGKPITLDNSAATVVGVLPAAFDFGAVFAPGTHIELFSPFPLSPETDRWGNTLALIGRLKPDARLPGAQAEASTLGKRISDEHPKSNGLDPKLLILAQHVSGQLRFPLIVLACSVGVVMLIVCANLSNLLLARMILRQKEMAIRSALGAGLGRLVSQLLIENLLLTLLGSVLGIALAFAGTRAITHLTAFEIPLLSAVHLDAAALGFILLMAAITTLLLGTAPALQLSLAPLNASLGQRDSAETKTHKWTRSALVISEIAFACVLLVGAGLLFRSLIRVLDVDLGFRPEQAAALRIDPDSRYATQASKNGYFGEVLRRVRALPGVEHAGLTDVLPLGHNRSWGSPAKGQVYLPNDFPVSFVRVVSEGYVRAMGMRLVQGRDLTENDSLSSKPVILINQTLAQRLWPGQNPIGQVIQGDCGQDRQVVGVVGNVRHMALEKSSGFEMYLPIRQCEDYGSVDLVVRSRVPLPVLSSIVNATLRPVAPDLPKGGMRPLQQLVDRAASPRRFTVALLTGFASFALVLAALGIYAVISFMVNHGTREIGIRLALGATARDVQRGILLGTLGLASGGILIGLLAAFVLARSLGSLLYGITFSDPLTFSMSIAALLAVALLAGYLPARRASKIDPMEALRAI